MVLAVALTLLDFNTNELAWRAERETNLKKPTGWLAVAGLHWLSKGNNVLGQTMDADIQLRDTAGEFGGEIDWQKGDKFLVRIFDGGRKPGGKDFEDYVKVDEKLYISSLTFSIIHRGDRYGLRVWDPKAPTRTNFKGLSWYAPKPEYKVKAKFVPYKTPRQLPITNILGYTEPAPNPGYLSFTLKGKKLKLEAIDEGETYFLNFKDRTSGTTTYPAGRFIDLEKRKDGNYEINFNRAYNPPCAFTNFATCPLPPKQNILNVSIEAGEKTHHPG